MAALVPPDIPDRRGGWWHEYVCPAHGTQLAVPSDSGRFPCPHGCVLTGEPYAGAWAVLAHQSAARSLRALAVASAPAGSAGSAGSAASAGSGSAGSLALAAAEACLAGLTRYAALYRELGASVRTDAQGWMLAGRMFQQALTEAIWGTSIALAVQTLAGSVPPDRLRPVVPLLEALRSGAAEARDVLLARDDFRNNYTAWLNACGASTSRALALLGEPDLTASWLVGPHGIEEHAAAAVYPDGWEWEGSTYYHVFVLRGYLLALRAQPLAPSLVSRLISMVEVVAALATDHGGVLPALNDTPYGDTGWDEELFEMCLLASALPGAPDLAFLASPVAARLPSEMVRWRRAEFAVRDGRPPVPDAAPGVRGSRLFADAGYAVLAGDGYRAVFDLGPHGGSHGHLDKLALYLYGTSAPWQPAYGVPPYGHPWRRGYYRTTAAHPTLTVDGADQAEAAGRLLYWRCADGRAEVGAAADVFAGVRFERHLRAEPGWLLDVVRVRADRERDFTLHLRTDVAVAVFPFLGDRGAPATPGSGDVRTTHRAGGADTHRAGGADTHRAGGAETRWAGDGGLTGRHVALPGTAVLTTAPDLGPADDPQRTRPHLRWLTRAAEATFVSLYTPGGAAAPEFRVDGTPSAPLIEVDGRTWTVPSDETPAS